MPNLSSGDNNPPYIFRHRAAFDQINSSFNYSSMVTLLPYGNCACVYRLQYCDISLMEEVYGNVT